MNDLPGSDTAEILLIDDQPITKVLLGRMLKTEENMTLHYVQDPATAEAKAQEIHPTVILLDLMMPDIDGLELLKRFRRQSATQNVPIVMLSSIESPHQKAEAFALGVSDYVIKLPDPVEMIARIRHHSRAHLAHIHQQKAERELQQHRDHLEEMVKDRTHELSQVLATNKEREAYLRTVLENALDAIITIDLQGHVIDYNPAAEKLFGHTKAEAIGQPIDTLIIPPELREKHREALKQRARSISGSHAFRRRIELPGQHKNGQYIDLEIAMTMAERQGQPYFTAFLHDITDHKQLLKSLEETLAVAQSASQAKSEFVANVSHEIRTPMNAVIGFSELALMEDPPKKLRGYLNKVCNASHGLMGIINDILDFSKIESGKFTLHSVVFTPSEVCDHLAGLFSKQVSEKNIELLFAMPSDFNRTLFGDNQRLGQILINLIRNAIKFTDSGTIVVRGKVGKPEPDPTQPDRFYCPLTFSVQDTGIGIDPDRLPHLFKPFVQADGSTSRKYGGTGIGLTISKQLVTMMGGNIWAESVLDKGSIFHFSVRMESPKTKGKESQKRPENMANMKVLVMDDNPLTRDILQEMLVAWSFIPTGVGSGEEALATLMANNRGEAPYTLAILDGNMPEMDAVTTSRDVVTQLFSELPPGHIPKIVMMTDFGREIIHHNTQEAWVDAFLDKPFTQTSLFHAIMEAFEEKRDPAHPAITVLSNTIDTREATQGARILLVEDNVINQEIATDLLTRAGMVITIANNGKEAVAQVEQHPFDAVLMDLQMPEMDGYEATRRIRAHARFKDLPIIAMTAHTLAEEQQKCLDAGMNDHMAKPFRPERLYGLLTQWVGPLQKPTPTPEKEKTTPLPDIPGINQTDGLQRVNGNRVLYNRLLNRFHEDQAHTLQKMEDALEQGDTKEAMHLAHAIKGVAGNLGAHALHRAAEALETALSTEKPAGLAPMKQAFSEALTPILKTLDTMNAPPRMDASPGATPSIQQQQHTIDTEQILPLLLDMATHLENFSLETDETMEHLHKQLVSTQAATAWREVEKHTQQYDFVAARNALDKLATVLGIPPETLTP